jgi:KUP system potassium uptake protein
MFAPFLLVEGAFLAANLTKIAHGGYVPLLIATFLIVIMASWVRGTTALRRIESHDPRLEDVLPMLTGRGVMRAKGTAVFLTSDPEAAPAALMHNLKHNQVLHEQVVILTVRTAGRPRTSEAERVEVRDLAPGVKSVILTFGYMETPDVARALRLAKAHGVSFDIMRTSFFLSRRVLVSRTHKGLAHVLDALYAYLARNAVRAADFFQIPPSRVVELGAQVVL